ncbi:1-deoxy-D-xylulose-5-phosphate synthase [Bifidobacterium sp. CP2]|uniref:1-deoxy-D-xylulose-5-phosphate synthase n=1 Tax=Bifidobacterium sp. CP2 TaxID=2809025 RepID=UPI001BDD80D7|nr:1-deoxy-D-xylulose-5-phosphate synthase [Bifidobacterium sp. CP2]MBT1181027.1 1-deoxy-D-xylulose-5-phosphate synthase [Bifidobacterium sp. CP2]
MANGIMERISGPADVKALSHGELHALCKEIRAALLRYGREHGGHIGSNLGMVEATVALHRVFDSPRDRIVFDVSHQSYVHKMLTGRAAAYLDPSRFDEVTGFTNPDESVHDQFVLGHTGTSISLACGLAKTRDMERAAGDADGMDSGIGNVVAVIGDGSLSSGVAFEGMNNAAEQGGNLIIVFNDNEMSIAGDFGGMYGPLARLRASDGTAQPNIFNAFGLDYRYVADGNDVDALVAAFEEIRDIDHPVVVHIHTLKGAGFAPEPTDAKDASDVAAHGVGSAHATDTGVNATDNVGHTEPWHSDHCNLSDHEPHEGQCEASHWQTPDKAIGRPEDPRKHYGKIAMAALERRFPTEPGLVVISPATPGSNGITHEFRERAGAHYMDTGITEAHAVTVACGIAKAGGTPVVATTASFFQRAYDMFFQEMSLNRSRVTILDFLGGLSGSDNTHSGAYDVTMFANIPGVTMLLPTSREDYLDALAWATTPATVPAGADGAPDGPVVIRVPGEAILAAERAGEALGHAATRASGTHGVHGTSDMLSYRTTRHGSTVALLGLGNAYPLAWHTAESLAAEGIDATVVDPRQCTTLDTTALESLRDDHRLVVTLEDGQLEGGWGEKVTAYYANHRMHAAETDRTNETAGTDDGRGARDPRNPRVINVGAEKEFTDRIPLADLDERYGLTVDAVTARVRRALAD